MIDFSPKFVVLGVNQQPGLGLYIIAYFFFCTAKIRRKMLAVKLKISIFA